MFQLWSTRWWVWWGRAWLSPVTAPPATPTPGTGPHSSSGTRTRPSSPSTGQSTSLLLYILSIQGWNCHIITIVAFVSHPSLVIFHLVWWVSSLTFKVHGLDTAKMLIFVLLSPLQLNKWVYKHDKDIKYVESVLLEYKCRFLQSSF